MSECSTSTCSTTTTSGRTEAWRFAHQRGMDIGVVPGGITAAVSVGRRDRFGGLVHEYYQVAA